MLHVKQMVCAITLACLLAACGQDGTITKKDVGMVVGGAAGGAAGSAIWSHDPAARTLGTILGVVVGAAAGGYLGKMWDDYDRKQVAQSLEYSRDNASSQWRNPNTNQTYSMKPVKTYYEADGSPCREFTQTITIDGRKETGRGTACRQPDGTWKITNMQ